jgi:hypothetical protein
MKWIYLAGDKKSGRFYRDYKEHSDSEKVICYLTELPLTLEEDSCPLEQNNSRI